MHMLPCAVGSSGQEDANTSSWRQLSRVYCQKWASHSGEGKAAGLVASHETSGSANHWVGKIEGRRARRRGGVRVQMLPPMERVWSGMEGEHVTPHKGKRKA